MGRRAEPTSAKTAVEKGREMRGIERKKLLRNWFTLFLPLRKLLHAARFPRQGELPSLLHSYGQSWKERFKVGTVSAEL